MVNKEATKLYRYLWKLPNENFCYLILISYLDVDCENKFEPTANGHVSNGQMKANGDRNVNVSIPLWATGFVQLHHNKFINKWSSNLDY